MKKIFKFGKIDFEGRGEALNSVTITAELKEDSKGRPVFTASGEVWNRYHRDTIVSGQCLDDIKPYFENNKEFLTLFDMWKKYHLNDMRTTCEHQRALGWDTIAGEKITIYHFKLKYETSRERDRAKADALKAIKEGKTYKASPEDLELLNLEYFLTSQSEKLADDIAPYYELRKTEQKLKGWTEEKEHSEGILSKACPVCGYKYGTSWYYEEMKPKDLEKIKHLLKEEL